MSLISLFSKETFLSHGKQSKLTFATFILWSTLVSRGGEIRVLEFFKKHFCRKILKFNLITGLSIHLSFWHQFFIHFPLFIHKKVFKTFLTTSIIFSLLLLFMNHWLTDGNDKTLIIVESLLRLKSTRF